MSSTLSEAGEGGDKEGGSVLALRCYAAGPGGAWQTLGFQRVPANYSHFNGE